MHALVAIFMLFAGLAVLSTAGNQPANSSVETSSTTGGHDGSTAEAAVRRAAKLVASPVAHDEVTTPQEAVDTADGPGDDAVPKTAPVERFTPGRAPPPLIV
ncbi:MAG TPA: hypothetical protein VNQ73_05455 [Ilumatobacter sp.]|nr:hypothetical protein [Ilumatobacter sp.]